MHIFSHINTDKMEPEGRERKRRRTRRNKMGPGEEIKIRSDPYIEILERGEIFFFYRPKIDKEEAHGPNDVQRTYIVLRPESAGNTPVQQKQDPHSGKEGSKSASGSGHPTEGGHGVQVVNVEKDPLFRLIVIGRKRLPDPSKKKNGRPFWGFVELVTTKVEEVKIALQGEEYDAATRGHKRKKPAVPFGEGVYRILRHKYGDGEKVHTHLIYKLEFPSNDERNGSGPQEALNVEREGSFIIQVKNPHPGRDPRGGSEFSGVRKERKARFPAHLQGLFGKLRFHLADPPDFLNYEGCEILLIPASDNVEEELGLELKTDTEEEEGEEREDHHEHDASCSDLIKTFGEIGRTEALFRGTWV